MSEAHDGAAPAVTEDTTAADQVTEETQAQGDEQSGDDAAAETDQDGDGQSPAKPRRSAQERINEAVRAQREAERDRDFYREQASRAAPQPQAQPQAVAEEGEPDPTAYEHGEFDSRFIRDHAAFHAKRTIREELAKERARTEGNVKVAAFNTAAEAVAQKQPDFYQVVGQDFGKAAALCTDSMREAVLEAETGPDIAYHLAKNPAEARRIAALPPLAQVLEIGKLSQKLATPPAPTPKTATDAPGVTPQVRGSGGRFTVAPDTDDFAAFDAQYK